MRDCPHGRYGSRTTANAIKALRFLIGFAWALREVGHPVQVIEIVAGNRIGSLWPGRELETGEDAYVATVLNEEDAWDRLFAALEELADEARRAKIQIAIEAEPGDLFLVSDE